MKIFTMYVYEVGDWWIRVGSNGIGLSFLDHRKHPPLFSCRYGRIWNRLHIGPYCIKFLFRAKYKSKSEEQSK